jgi:hypothetical protein
MTQKGLAVGKAKQILALTRALENLVSDIKGSGS